MRTELSRDVKEDEIMIKLSIFSREDSDERYRRMIEGEETDFVPRTPKENPKALCQQPVPFN
jgi:hypothetical protein